MLPVRETDEAAHVKRRNGNDFLNSRVSRFVERITVYVNEYK